MSRLFRSTIDDIRKQIKANGCSITKLSSPERAQKLCKWLKEKLPRHLDVWVIDAPNRENEVNVYTIDKTNREGDTFGGIVRSTERSGMPEKVREWKKRHFKL